MVPGADFDGVELLPPRVEAAVEEIARGAFSPGQMLVRLEGAVARGSVAAHLERIRAADERRRNPVEVLPGAAVAGPGTAGRRSTRRTATLTIVPWALALIGPMLTRETGRASSSGLPLDPAAMAAGSMALVGAVFLLAWELRRGDELGLRTRLAPPWALVFPVFFGLSGIWILYTRVVDAWPYVSQVPFVGMGMLALSTALVLIAMLLGVRHLRRAGAAPLSGVGPGPVAAAPEEVWGVPLEDLSGAELDEKLAERVRGAVREQPERDGARAAVAAGARELHSRGELSDDEARWLLRQLEP